MSRCEKILNEQVKSLRAKIEALHTANCQQLCDIADLKMEAIEANDIIVDLVAKNCGLKNAIDVSKAESKELGDMVKAYKAENEVFRCYLTNNGYCLQLNDIDKLINLK